MSHTGEQEVNHPLAEVLDLQVLVDYQKGTVVSRTLINKKIGTVTLFAFDTGEGLSEHTAPFDKPHELKAVKRFKMMLVMIRS